jgi:predicted dehydrogenase
LVEVPAPALSPGQILVRNVNSVMSPGTEKMAMDFARKSMLGKARSRPDLVKQVTRKLAQEGPLPTYRTVMNRLDAPQPLGYASAGIVEQVGEGVESVLPGDRVACAGAGYANHAELVVVPENLVAHIPSGLAFESAAFATLGAIAMQGLRVGDPTLGEVVAVVGLGLIGQLTVQLLLANGCRVYGIDLDPGRVEASLALGMEWGGAPGDDHASLLASLTGGHGADLVIVTAASESSAPIHLAAELCRHRGRVVAVGATAMELDRRVFYEKELELRMSMSYGPGRYDYRYEEGGVDYPLAYVRWTEQRNLQSFLDLAARGAIDPSKLSLESCPFESAPTAYEELARGERSKQGREKKGALGVGFIGAGNYAKAVLLPAVQGEGALRAVSVVTSTGPSAHAVSERFGFSGYGTDPEAVLGDDAIDLVFIATRHDSHARLAIEALQRGKSVWLEKPVALLPSELDELEAVARNTEGSLIVGYNRRFSSHATRVRDAFATRSGPLSIQYSVAAGPPPSGTWIMDPSAGGGRILGEACHFVDLCDFLVGGSATSVYARALGRESAVDDSVIMMLGYADGSTATISYLAKASPELPKERWEVHAEGGSAICENFRVTQLPGGKKHRTMNQDKGQASAISEFARCLQSGAGSPVALDSILATSRTTFSVLESMRTGLPSDPATMRGRSSLE